MTIEDRLRACRPREAPAALKARVLAASKPWRPWYLAGAAAILVCLMFVNEAIDSRLRGLIDTAGASPTTGGFESVNLPGAHVFLTLAGSTGKKRGDSWLDLRSGRLP